MKLAKTQNSYTYPHQNSIDACCCEQNIIEFELVEDYVLDTEVEGKEFEIDSEFTDVIQTNITGKIDYRSLSNLPTINGTKLVNNYDEIDPTVPSWAKTTNKPNYTAQEVGAVDENSLITDSEIDAMISAVFGI